MSYKITTTAPVSVSQAQELGRIIGKYAITLSGLSVVHVYEDGSKHADNPMARTIADTATESGIGGGTGIALAGPLAAAGLVIPVIALPGLLAAAAGVIKARHEMNKRDTPAKALYSEITFGFANVGPDRLKWGEDLISMYCQRYGWQLSGLHHAEAWAYGGRYAGSHSGMPTPWLESPRGKGTTAKPPKGIYARLKRHMWG